MKSIINLICWILLISAIILFPIFIGLLIMSMLITPLTWIYAKITNKSYRLICDQSEIIYQLNKFGRLSLLIGGSILTFSIFILCL